MKKQKKNVPNPQIQQIQRYTPEPDYGLTQAQVDRRVEEGLTNHVTDSASKTTGQIIRGNLFTYFNLIFFILALVLIYERSYNNLMFLVVVFVNTLIGTIQELKSKHTLDRLKLLSAPEVTVIREGREQQVPSENLVLDDVVLFHGGNQICADAVLCGGSLTVNEALVTGESDEIQKESGDRLLSGSFVVSGTAKARLDQVGDASFAAKLAKDAKQVKKKQQPGMMKSLTRLIQIIGIIIIPFAGMMFWNQYHVLGLSEKLSVEHTAASLIGMIPEGLYLLTSVALAASTIRLAKKHTLVHDMKCIETLARVDTLCVDKTGTITEAAMEVEEVLPLPGQDPDVCDRVIGEFVRTMSADNETMKVLKAHWGKQLPGKKAADILGFSSQRKFSAVRFAEEGTYVLGAPEKLMPPDVPEVERLLAAHSAQGERVLLFGSCEEEEADTIFSGGTLEHGVTPMVLLVLTNAIRPQAEETFRYFREQGVGIKVISGDNPLTAALAAEKAGIAGAEAYVDASTLRTEDDLTRAVSKYTVFGRVTPEQKRALIRALKKEGHTVAMTGDGVNDVLALKEADCSIAMASGSEAAANVSDLVLLQSDFSGMPQVVAEGRRVINNIERSASLFLAKNVFSFLLSLISLVSVSIYPMKPIQFSLISGLMIGIPSFFLALEPNEERVRGKFLRNVLYRALPAGLTAVVLVQWMLMICEAFHVPPEQASTMCFLLYGISAYLMLYRVCKPMSIWHGILFGAMGVLFVLALVVIPSWIQVVPLTYGSVLVLVPMLLLTRPLDRFWHLAFEKMAQWKQKLIARIHGTDTETADEAQQE